jgi:phosphatidylinositol-3-phosphatase
MMRHRIRLLAVAAALAATLAGSAPATGTTSGLEGVPAFGHVFVIVGENTDLSALTAKNAPYQLKTIAPNAAWFTNYFATTHWSTANYIAMTSGQYIHCEQEDIAPADCNQDVNNLFHQLEVAGVSWKEWNESMPEPCALVSSGTSKDGNSYRVKHNPAVYYADIEGAGGVWSATHRSAECLSHVVAAGGTGVNDMSLFNAALASGAVPRFNFVVPNQCEDGHDNCKPNGGVVTQFDDFLAREVPAITRSPAWNASSVIVVVYDEGQSGGPNNGTKFGGGNVPFAVIGPRVHPAVYTQLNNHYGLLRTLEDGFGISRHLAGARNATPMSQIWN